MDFNTKADANLSVILAKPGHCDKCPSSVQGSHTPLLTTSSNPTFLLDHGSRFRHRHCRSLGYETKLARDKHDLKNSKRNVRSCDNLIVGCTGSEKAVPARLNNS